jgi:DNA gyrase/topoisomerase IV subunit A
MALRSASHPQSQRILGRPFWTGWRRRSTRGRLERAGADVDQLLRKGRERLHVIDALPIALDNLHDVIELIHNAESADAARAQLMERYSLSEIQTHVIMDIQLRRLATLERQRILDEVAALRARVAELEAIVARRDAT